MDKAFVVSCEDWGLGPQHPHTNPGGNSSPGEMAGPTNIVSKNPFAVNTSVNKAVLQGDARCQPWIPQAHTRTHVLPHTSEH